MATEETPLLSGALPYKNELIYERFSPAYKKFILAIVAWSGLMPCKSFHFPFNSHDSDVNSSVLDRNLQPFDPSDCQDLNTTGERVGFCGQPFHIATCIGSLVSASYATFYGRRPTYLISLPLCIIAR
ncbi:hypothetical protein D9756_011513 [Leucocoprinus leucothites]|uniref:Uncharacterized protein n=1 Tax=Leucocoprinus leucothites TaxID=201217 RepID=A0A8H5FQH8_9AGAR|nr:hypothetical protein D9756_011513 [Leucoagaricus leucothites]